MKIRVKQWFLCGFIFSVILLAASWAQYDGEESYEPENEEEQTGDLEQESQKINDDSWWQERADTNKDGSVDDQELGAWKELESKYIDTNHDGQIDEQEKRLSWKYVRSPISTVLESEFDADSDGWLEPEEARKLLFRGSEELIFNAKGRGPINTGLEKLYDTNGDGVIDLRELKTLREDLK